MADTWDSLKDEVRERTYKTAGLAYAILIDLVLFVAWIAFESGADFACEYCQQHGMHEVCAFIFRWVASITILCFAGVYFVVDLSKVAGWARAQIYCAWNKKYVTCPAKVPTAVVPSTEDAANAPANE